MSHAVALPVEKLAATKIDGLAAHLYISKSQFHLWQLKKIQSRIGTVIVLANVTENYSIIVQGESQEFN